MTTCILIRRNPDNPKIEHALTRPDGRIPYWGSYSEAYKHAPEKSIALEAPSLEAMQGYLGAHACLLVAA